MKPEEAKNSQVSLTKKPSNTKILKNGNENPAKNELKFKVLDSTYNSPWDVNKLTSKQPVKTKKGALYDKHGIHRQSGRDLCDCMLLSCSGCHFPCSSCRSNKCGHICRVNRDFVYNGLFYDGKDLEYKNPMMNSRKGKKN